VHRDLKPSNVFLTPHGVKLLDFGLARLTTRSGITRRGMILGTPDYMSPEQARGANIDGRSDIFSLGGVFYFMMTGRKPFPASDLPTLFHQIQSEDPPPPLGADVPPELATLIMKALSKKREKRYQNCQEILADLDLLKQRYPLPARPAAGGPTISEGAASLREALPAATATPAVPAEAGPPATEDTVDFLPVPSFDSDETVTLGAPLTLRKRIVGRIDSAISGVIARLGRPSTSAPTRQTGRRKR
jgi:serine/threonine protein kinase